MSAETSPAPWRILPDSDGGFAFVEIIAHNGTQVASLESGSQDDEPITEADARLIAAAPALRDALRKAAGVISGETTTKADLIAALEATRAALKQAGAL